MRLLSIGIGPAEGDSANSQGIARLRAALQAHMWSGMSLKEPGRRPSPSGAGLLPSSQGYGALAGGPSGEAESDLSSDEEEADAGEPQEELTAEELGSLLGYAQLGTGQDEEEEVQQGEEPDLQHGDESERASTSKAAQRSGGGPPHEPPEWGPYLSMAPKKAQPAPGLESAGEGGGNAPEEGAAQHEVTSQAKAGCSAATSGSPEVGLVGGSALPGLVAGPSSGLTEVAGDADEGHLRSLEQLLGRVAAVREQGASLPDAARREMAAATALQLASLLCGRDDEDDS